MVLESLLWDRKKKKQCTPYCFLLSSSAIHFCMKSFFYFFDKNAIHVGKWLFVGNNMAYLLQQKIKINNSFIPDKTNYHGINLCTALKQWKSFPTAFLKIVLHFPFKKERFCITFYIPIERISKTSRKPFHKTIVFEFLHTHCHNITLHVWVFNSFFLIKSVDFELHPPQKSWEKRSSRACFLVMCNWINEMFYNKYLVY